jgi:thiol-disulfide isomerase/thioredoxin
LEPVGPGVNYPNINNIGFFYDFSKFGENVKSARILREETLKVDGQNSTCYAIEVFHYPTNKNLQKEDPLPEAIWIDKSSHLVRQLTYQEVKPGTNSQAGLNVSHVVNLSSYKLNVDPPAWLISANADFAKASANRRAAKVGTVAADFKVVDLDGAELTLSSLRDKVVLLEFWDTWCAPCRAELPIIMKVQRDLAATDSVVVRITDESAEDVRAFQKDTRQSFRTFVEGGDVLRQYKIYARPVLIVIDKKGMISSYDESLITAAELIERIKKAGLN